MILLGSGLRVRVYLANRSLFLDEANLARAVLESNYADFFGTLPYQQYAPPGFTIPTKLLTQLINGDEWVLRLLPLLAGIAALPLLYRLLQRVGMPPLYAALALLIAAIHPSLIRYATEFKQYGTDVFWTLLALNYLPTQLRSYRSLAFALLPLFSMPTVFVLGAAGLHWLTQGPQLRRWCVVCGSWLLIFLLYYWFTLRTDIDSGYLQSYHQPFFLGGNRSLPLLQNLIKQPYGFTIIAQIIGGIGLLLSFWQVLRERHPVLQFCWGTILLTLLASALHQYTLIDRAVLFLSPVLLVLAFAGWSYVARLSWILIPFTIHLATLPNGLGYWQNPPVISDARDQIAYLHTIQPDQLVLNRWASVPLWYYAERRGAAYPLLNTTILTTEEVPISGTYLLATHLVSDLEIRRFSELRATLPPHRLVREGTDSQLFRFD